MRQFDFSQVDVFASGPLTGNPVAVVHDADPLSDAQMAAFARWTNLSETTFLLAPTGENGAADYRLRIFTPGGELPFAGHPTLGSAHAWLARGGQPAAPGRVIQECGIGLVELADKDGTLAFRAPELLRAGPVEPDIAASVTRALRLQAGAIRMMNWVDNGPGWIGVVLDSAATVLALQPDMAAMRAADLRIGVIGPHDAARPADYEVRAFVPTLAVAEDPVTGSLNAGLAVWLTSAGVLPPSYTVRQGTALGRAGDVQVRTDAAGGVWIAGRTTTVISGTVSF